MAVSASRAREELNALKALAGRLRDDLDSALERIGLAEQRQLRAAAAEERAEGFLKLRLMAANASENRARVVSSIRLIA